MNKLTRIAILIACTTIVAVGQKAPGKTASSSPGVDASNVAQDPGYVIGSEDVLNVNVWKEPELSGSVPVRPDGKISLPLLNDIQAAGLTPMQLGARLTESLKKYVDDPHVNVTVTAMNSRRIYLTGQIGRPGAMPLMKDMTIMEALASAGCCMEFAKTSKIYVLRNENGKQMKYPFNYKDALKGRTPTQNIVLKPGDTIVVP